MYTILHLQATQSDKVTDCQVWQDESQRVWRIDVVHYWIRMQKGKKYLKDLHNFFQKNISPFAYFAEVVAVRQSTHCRIQITGFIPQHHMKHSTFNCFILRDQLHAIN